MANRTIDAMALVTKLSSRARELLQQNASGQELYDAILQVIAEAPTLDAVEVVHGRWEWLGPNSLVPECMCGTCSVCKVRSKYIVNTNICPNCGAKMDGDGNG